MCIASWLEISRLKSCLLPGVCLQKWLNTTKKTGCSRERTKLLLIFYVSLLYIIQLRILFFLLRMSYFILMIFLWLIFGSLGSVVMTRFSDWITRKNIRGFFFGRSECPHCKHTLKAKNLIPVVSYLVQWGKCEYCKKKISRIYPVLELLSAGVFVVSYFLLKDFWTPILIFWLLTNRLLILLLIYDLKKYELHMTIWIMLMITGILVNIFVLKNLRNALFAAILFGIVFMGIYFFAKRYTKIRFKKNREGFGEWDVYLAAWIWLYIPIICSLQWMVFSWMMLANVLILFVLMSSIIGLIRGWLQYFFTKIFGTWDMELGKRNISSASLVPSLSSLQVVPFFPAMIIAFWILAWKLSFFISLVFPLAW